MYLSGYRAGLTIGHGATVHYQCDPEEEEEETTTSAEVPTEGMDKRRAIGMSYMGGYSSYKGGSGSRNGGSIGLGRGSNTLVETRRRQIMAQQRRPEQTAECILGLCASFFHSVEYRLGMDQFHSQFLWFLRLGLDWK